MAAACDSSDEYGTSCLLWPPLMTAATYRPWPHALAGCHALASVLHLHLQRAMGCAGRARVTSSFGRLDELHSN